jgi:hypothetical protein
VVSHFHWGGALVEHGLFEAAGGYCDEYAGWGKEERLTVRAWRVAAALACLHFEHPRPYTALDIEPNRQLLERRRALGAKEMIRLDTAATTRARRPVRKRPDARQPSVTAASP